MSVRQRPRIVTVIRVTKAADEARWIAANIAKLPFPVHPHMLRHSTGWLFHHNRTSALIRSWLWKEISVSTTTQPAQTVRTALPSRAPGPWAPVNQAVIRERDNILFGNLNRFSYRWHHRSHVLNPSYRDRPRMLAQTHEHRVRHLE